MTRERDPWELESGLPNDVDAYMWNCRFGTKDQYVQAVAVTGEEEGVAGLMFIADLYTADGIPLGGGDQPISQGWSVGSGWVPSQDGKAMHHPTRKNVVENTRYGQLQVRVLKQLGVNMREYGVPTDARSWDGLGFHWMMEELPTIRGKEPKRVLMPTLFLGKKPESEDPTKKQEAAGVSASADVAAQLNALVAASKDIKEFQRLALKIEAVTKDDNLMSSVLDSGPNGYYAQHKPRG